MQTITITDKKEIKRHYVALDGMETRMFVRTEWESEGGTTIDWSEIETRHGTRLDSMTEQMMNNLWNEAH